MTTTANTIVQGDTLSFVTRVPDYPATAGWVLTYSLRGPSVLDLVATTINDAYQITASPAQTEALVPGNYYWVAYVSLSGNRFTVDEGKLTVKADLTQQVAGYDGRTAAAIALAAAEAALVSFRSSGGLIKSYTIGDRDMHFQDVSQLLAVISKLKRQVLNEETADRISNGLGNPRKMYVRFAG